MLQLNSLCAQPSAQNPKLCLHTSNLSHGSSFSARRYGLSVAKASGKNKLAVKSRQSEYYEQQRFAASRPSSTNSTFAPQSPLPVGVGDVSPRVFVGHSIYKGKAALTVEPRAPEFAALASGAFKLAKEGFLLLQFAPAASPRQYDWNRKQVFSLSVTEIGNLVSLNTRDSCEFFHDPNKGRRLSWQGSCKNVGVHCNRSLSDSCLSCTCVDECQLPKASSCNDEGKVRKVLRVEPLPDGSGHFFNLSVQNKLLNMDESIYIPVTKAEYTVLVSAFNYILPYLLGWHAFANSIRLNDTSRTNNATPRYGEDYEWNR